MSKPLCFISDLLTGEQAEYDCEEHILKCSKCKYEFVLVNMNEDGDTWTDQLPNYCPNCGAKALEQELEQ